MSVFSKYRATFDTTFKGDKFTLMQPSAYSRNQYLLEISKLEQQKKQEDKENGSKTDIDFKMLANNTDMSLYLIALCLHESLALEFEPCLSALRSEVDSDFIEHFYPLAENLTWPPAPEGTADPKADPVSDLPTV